MRIKNLREAQDQQEEVLQLYKLKKQVASGLKSQFDELNGRLSKLKVALNEGQNTLRGFRKGDSVVVLSEYGLIKKLTASVVQEIDKVNSALEQNFNQSAFVAKEIAALEKQLNEIDSIAKSFEDNVIEYDFRRSET